MPLVYIHVCVLSAGCQAVELSVKRGEVSGRKGCLLLWPSVVGWMDGWMGHAGVWRCSFLYQRTHLPAPRDVGMSGDGESAADMPEYTYYAGQ